MEEEIHFHIEMETERLVREQRLTRDEARRQAVISFGGVEKHKETMREGRRVPFLEDLLRDVHYAVRSLRRSMGFTSVAVLTLALGIGAGTAMFSVLNGVLLHELPIKSQKEVVVLWTEASARASAHLPVMYQDLSAFREQTSTFQSLAGVGYYGAVEVVLLDAGRPVTLAEAWVTGDFFRLLGVSAVRGRLLAPSDDVPGAPLAIVLSYGFWQRYFAGSPRAVGHAFEWSGKHYTVVGVLPRGFDYPKGTDFWAPVLPAFPATLEAEAESSDIMFFDLVGRLRPGGTVQAATKDFDAFLRSTDARRTPGERGTRAVVTPLPELIVGDTRDALWIAAAAVGLLLLVACVNVANLLLIQGAARSQELAIRSALGAGNRRLLRQLLTESAVLALLGGLLGAMFAFAAVKVLVAFAPPELPRREMIEVNAGVLLFALVTTAATALLSGLLPAILATSGDLSLWLRGGERTGSSTRAIQRLRHGLVIGQVMLAVVVVVGAGLLVRSLIALQNANMGFNQERLLVLQTMLPPSLLLKRPQQLAMQEEMLARIRAMPGVVNATSLPSGPFSGEGGWSATYTAEGQTGGAQATNPWVDFAVVDPEYFRTLEIPIDRGRAFGKQDREDARRVAILSQTVARHTWPGQDPVGKRIKIGPHDSPGPWYTVVGLVGETRYRDLTQPQPSLYLPLRQFDGPLPMTLAVRTRSDPGGMIPQIRRALHQVHPELMVVGGGSMRQLLAGPLAPPRFRTMLLGMFAAITMLLAAVGIYGAMAAVVRQRTREIGIRLALGATANGVRSLVLRQGIGLALWGYVAGVAGALVGSRVLRSMLFGIGPADPVTYLAVGGLMLATAALACYVPARRASRVDPAIALRAE
jgi:predicted permease